MKVNWRENKHDKLISVLNISWVVSVHTHSLLASCYSNSIRRFKRDVRCLQFKPMTVLGFESRLCKSLCVYWPNTQPRTSVFSKTLQIDFACNRLIGPF